MPVPSLLERFEFPNHSMTWKYPKGTDFQFGNGYRFAARPQLPLQRTFTLSFSTMFWQYDEDGEPDPTIQPETNIWALIQFFERHLNHKSFVYPADILGDLVVRFSVEKEFAVPKGTGAGAVEGFELELLEMPV